jgi:hypothetical protein
MVNFDPPLELFSLEKKGRPVAGRPFLFSENTIFRKSRSHFSHTSSTPTSRVWFSNCCDSIADDSICDQRFALGHEFIRAEEARFVEARFVSGHDFSRAD